MKNFRDIVCDNFYILANEIYRNTNRSRFAYKLTFSIETLTTRNLILDMLRKDLNANSMEGMD